MLAPNPPGNGLEDQLSKLLKLTERQMKQSELDRKLLKERAAAHERMNDTTTDILKQHLKTSSDAALRQVERMKSSDAKPASVSASNVTFLGSTSPSIPELSTRIAGAMKGSGEFGCRALEVLTKNILALRTFLTGTHVAPSGAVSTKGLVDLIEMDSITMFFNWLNEDDEVNRVAINQLQLVVPTHIGHVPIHESTVGWMLRVVEYMRPKIPAAIWAEFSYRAVWQFCKPYQTLTGIFLAQRRILG